MPLWLLTVVGLMGASLSAPARAAADPPPTPDPRFGAVETYHTPELADEIGVGWTRIIFYWSELERRGPDDWNPFHAPLDRIDREIKGGREVVGMLAHTPKWATDGVEGAGVPRGLYLPVDDPNNLWAAFVRKTAGIYKGRVNRWIVWNEPDIPLDTYGAQWQGSVEDYYQLVKVAYLAAHEANPVAKIHLGGLTYWHDPDYLRRFLAVAKADPTAAEYGYYFDVVSAHLYFKPETTATIIGSIKQNLSDAGIDKPVWLNETNAPPYDDPAHPWVKPVFPVTQDMQASFLLQEFALAISEGVERVSVYKWIDQPPPQPGFDPYGLLRENGDPRPAFVAFKVILKHYAGTTASLHVEDGKYQEVILARGEQTTRVIWSRLDDSVVVVVPALSASGLLVDQSGGEAAIQPVAGYYLLPLPPAICPEGFGCFIGGPPLLLIEDAPTDPTPGSRVIHNLALTRTTLTRAGIVGGVVIILFVTGAVVWRRRRRQGRLW